MSEVWNTTRKKKYVKPRPKSNYPMELNRAINILLTHSYRMTYIDELTDDAIKQLAWKLEYDN